MFIEVEEFEAECRAEMNNYYENCSRDSHYLLLSNPVMDA